MHWTSWWLGLMSGLGLSHVVAASAKDIQGRWPWNEERRLERELQRARARVQFAEEGLKLRKREKAAQEELEEMKRGGER